MLSRKLLKVSFGVAICAGMALGTLTVAHAEGQRLSSISGWSVGTRSQVWSDSNSTTDGNAATRVYLSGVTLYVPYTNLTYTAKTVQLQLQQDIFGVGFTSQGNVTAAPGTYHSWGDRAAGTYKFQYNGSTATNGSFYGSGSGVNINASTANIYW